MFDVCAGFSEPVCSYTFNEADSDEKLKRANSITLFNIDDKNVEKSVEYFFASDARWRPWSQFCTCVWSYVLVNIYSAVIEYTNKVIFLEDDDVAAVTADGGK